MSALSSLILGLAVALGVWLAIQTALGNVVVGQRSRHGRRPRREPSRDQGVDEYAALFALAGATVGVAVLLSTRLVVAAAAAGLAVAMIPRVVRARRNRDHAIAKMRASADFVESIRASLGAGSGLEAAIVEAAQRPPAALSAELTAFVERTRLPEVTIEQALHRLADDAREPAIDLLVGSLLAALKGAAGDMGQLFERISDHGRAFAEMRALTQAERAKVEFQTKILSLLVVAVALLSVVVSPDLTSAYDASPVGQLRLLTPVAIFGFGWWWLNRMNQVEAQYRFRLRREAVG